VSFGTGIVSKRGVAPRGGAADAYALRLTHDPKAFISVERKLTTDNLSDPDPPSWLTHLFGTHPPAIERIGYALRSSATGALLVGELGQVADASRVCHFE